MSDKEIKIQINEINRKLDLIIEDRAIQKHNQDAIADLVDDVSMVGKDAFGSMVKELDNAGIELDGDSIKFLILGFIRNIENINTLITSLENVMDLAKDAGPIIKEVGVDAVGIFKEIDDKGYFELLRQITTALNNTMQKHSKNDLISLGDKLENIIDSIIAIFDPEFLRKFAIAIQTFNSIDTEEVEPSSIFKVIREFNKPEMKKTLGIMMTFLKEINSKK